MNEGGVRAVTYARTTSTFALTLPASVARLTVTFNPTLGKHIINSSKDSKYISKDNKHIHLKPRSL